MLDEQHLVIGSGQDLDLVLCDGLKAEGNQVIKCTYDEVPDVLSENLIIKAYVVINIKCCGDSTIIENKLREMLISSNIPFVLIYTAIDIKK